MLTIEETAKLMARPVLTEADCMAIINGEGDEYGTIGAEALLWAKMGDPIAARFKRLDKALVTLLADVREVFPDAQYYTASGGFNLMLGSPHDAKGINPQAELLALSGRAAIGDGDF